MPFVPSDAVLIALQAALVLAPGRVPRHGRWSAVGLAIPAAALVAGIVLAQTSASFLADLAAFATPVLAAASGAARGWRWRWLPAALVPPLYVVAWRVSGTLAADAASILLIAGACLTVTALVARLAPRPWLAAGLVLLVGVDCVLVWGERQVAPATTALQAATPLALLGRPLPPLQQATFGSAQMGWLDLAAPALLGLIVVRRRRASLATALAAAAWDLLFFITPLIAATPPVLAGLLAGYSSPRRHLRRRR